MLLLAQKAQKFIDLLGQIGLDKLSWSKLAIEQAQSPERDGGRYHQ